MGQLRLLGEPAASDDHAALTNLAFPQSGHTGFVATAGLAGGQTVIGGAAPGEHLSLQSTAHATRGAVRVIDALRLVSGPIQDAAGNPRIALAAASPHATITGDLLVAAPAGETWAHAAIAPAAIDASTWLNLNANLGSRTGTIKGINLSPLMTIPAPSSGAMIALTGQASLTVQSGATAILQGLLFTGLVAGAGAVSEMEGIWARLGSVFGSTCTIDKAAALYARAGAWNAAKPTRNYGLYVENMGVSGITDAVGILVEAPSGATNNYTAWLGAPITATPRLRLDAGTPGAGQTMLYLAEGVTPTLRRVQWVDPGNGGANLVAGQRVMILV